MIKKNIEITINSKTRQVNFEDNFLGINGENLQGYLIFKFEDNFVDGVPVVKVEQNGKSYNIYEVIKENETYKMLIKSSLLKSDVIYFALSITENGTKEEIPVFITKKFYMYVGETIESTEEIPDEYSAWIDVANSKLIDIDNSLEMANAKSEYAKGQGDYAKEQGDYAKQEGTKVDEIVDYVVKTSEEANEKSDTAISIAKGANQALDYLDYANMIVNFNAFEKEKFKTGQQIMIKKLNVPDVWIYQLTEEYNEYTYTTDEEVINSLLSDTGLHVGYYVLSALETQKVDLTNYVKNTDYANNYNAGVVKAQNITNANRGIYISSEGFLSVKTATNTEIDNRANTSNVITPSNLEYAVKSVGDKSYATIEQIGEIETLLSEV